MKMIKNKLVISSIIISVVLMIELLDVTFGKLLANLIPCVESNEIQLPCYMVYHIKLVLILSLVSIAGFIYWLILSKQKANRIILNQGKISFLKFHNLKNLLNDNINQKIINAIIAVGFLIILLAKCEYFYFASGITYIYKSLLLTYLTVLFILQTILNKSWLNLLILSVFTCLLIYIIYTFIYAFIDPYDIVMKSDYGLLIKTWQFILKSGFIILIILFIYKLKPIK